MLIQTVASCSLLVFKGVGGFITSPTLSTSGTHHEELSRLPCLLTAAAAGFTWHRGGCPGWPDWPQNVMCQLDGRSTRTPWPQRAAWKGWQGWKRWTKGGQRRTRLVRSLGYTHAGAHGQSQDEPQAQYTWHLVGASHEQWLTMSRLLLNASSNRDYTAYGKS